MLLLYTLFAYLSSCRGAALEASSNYWMIRTVLIAVITSSLEDPYLFRSFERFKGSVDFVKFMSTEFAACLLLKGRDNHRKTFSLPKDATI